MEAFSLLKYWRGGGGGEGAPLADGDSVANTRATTIVAAVAQNAAETDDDDGPFFDLEFALPDVEEEEDGNTNTSNNMEGKKEKNNGTDSDHRDEVVEFSDYDSDDGGREFNFTLSSDSTSSNDRTDPNLSFSPSDDLFFKGRLVPIESSLESNKHQFPVASLLKSATKFRVFMLGFKKSKKHAGPANETTEASAGNAVSPATTSTRDLLHKQQSVESKEESNNVNKQNNSKFFTVKFKVEEVPIVSLFTRENSKSVKTSSSLAQKPSSDQSSEECCAAAASDEKQRFSKDVMQKYLKKVKPLYIRVSKRYGEKLKFSGQLRLNTAVAPPATVVTEQKPVSSPARTVAMEVESAEVTLSTTVNNLVKSQKQVNNLPAGLRVVCKHLGKSRSASLGAVTAAPSVAGPVASRRSDDSLLQQQDGIQSAILHCKRSFNAARDSESSVLSRSVSDPSHEK